MTNDLQLRPTDPQFLLNPYPWLAKMRNEAPVFYDEEQQCWMVFRYEDVERVLSEWKTFSSKIPKPPEQKDFTRECSQHRSAKTSVTTCPGTKGVYAESSRSTSTEDYRSDSRVVGANEATQTGRFIASFLYTSADHCDCRNARCTP